MPVGVAEEAALGVHDEVATDHDPVGVNIRDVILQDVLTNRKRKSLSIVKIDKVGSQKKKKFYLV